MSVQTTDPGNKTPEQIEAEVEATRARVSSTLDEIQDRMAPGEIFEQAVTFARDNGAADMARNLARDVRDNPVPLLLVAAGMAWFAVSHGRGNTRTVYRDRYVADRDYDVDAEAYYGGEPLAGDPRARASLTGESYADDAGYYPGSRTEARRVGADSGPSLGQRASGYAAGASASAHDLASGAQSGASRAASGASSAAHSAASGVSGAAHSAASGVSSAAHSVGSGLSSAAEAVSDTVGSAVDTISDYASSAYDRVAGNARYARERGRRGYYVMTANGRRWVDDARYGARAYGSEAGRYASQAGNMLRDNPLLLGAFGLAIGAAIGAALPKTRIEDEYLGETSDAYKRQAWEAGQETFEEARSRVMAIGQRAYDEALGEARKQGLSPAEAEGKARAAGDAARVEAERAGSLARRGVAQAGSAARSGIGEAGETVRHGLEAGVSKVESVLDAAISGAKDEAEKQHLTPSDIKGDDASKSGDKGGAKTSGSGTGSTAGGAGSTASATGSPVSGTSGTSGTAGSGMAGSGSPTKSS